MNSGFTCDCIECCLPLADYGYNAVFIAGDNDTYIIREYCDLHAVEYCPENDYFLEVETNYENIIVYEPNKRDSQARIRGMQTTVNDILKSLASGMTEKEILKKNPFLTHRDILACFAFAAERI